MYMHKNSCCRFFYLFLLIASIRLSNFSRSCTKSYFVICIVFILSCMPINPPHSVFLIAYFDKCFFLALFHCFYMNIDENTKIKVCNFY